jgi:hypothetical protein
MFAPLSTAIAQKVAPIVPTVPSARPSLPERSPAEQLELNVKNLFELIAKPDPRLATFVHISNKTSVIVSKTKIDGNGDVAIYQGKKLTKALLTKLFTPEKGVKFIWGRQEIKIDGTFGRVRQEISIIEGERPPQRNIIYLDAFRERPGWWTFSQIVVIWHDRWWRGDK